MERGGAGASPPPRREGSATGDPGMGNSPRGCAHGTWGPFLPHVAQASRNAHKGRRGRWAGESSRKPRRPRPYSRAFAGRALRSASRPKAASMRVPCHHACPHEPVFFTTTRHAASLRSSNNCKCLIETFFIARVKSPLHKRLNPCGLFSAAPLLENGGFNQILPFLGGRSDAACRVVIWPSRPHLWEPMVFITPRWLGRAFATLDTSPTKRAMAPLRGRK